MRKIVFVIAMLILSLKGLALGTDKKDREIGPDPHFSATVRGGFFIPEDGDYRRFYGRWSNDIYFFELSYNFLSNFYVLGSVGGYYQRGYTIGELTGRKSGEDLTWTNVYLEPGLSYRFNFVRGQLITPFVSGSYVSLYYHEDADPGEVNDGWESGGAAWGGVLIHMDPADPWSALDLFRGYGVENTYFELSCRYNYVGKEGGVNMRGLMYLAGISFEF